MGSLILGSRTRTATADQPDVGLVVRDEEIRSPQDATIPITGGNLVLHPLDPETGYTFVQFVGPASSAVLPGPIVQLTYNPGVTTDIVMAAAVLADPASALLIVIPNPTGLVMPAGLGGTGGNLWQDLIAVPNAMYRRDPTTGHFVPWDGTVAIPGAVTVVQPNAALLNNTEANSATIAGRLINGALSVSQMLQRLYDSIAAQDANAPANALAAGVELVNPASLPADGIAGKVRRVLADLKGMLLTRAMLSVAGAAPTAQVGTLGRLNQDLSYAIAAGKTVVFHPLQHGVSVIVATAAAEAVSAAGLVVTFTDLNTDASTVTTMRAKLAASNAAGLVEIQLGTAVGGDTWNHLLTLAETPLWATGTVPAGADLQLDENGYQHQVESEIIPRAIYRAAAARKFAGVDAGAVTVTSSYVLGFTGVNLLGRALYALDLTSGRRHAISSVTDPSGATAGVINLLTPMLATTDTVIVAYASTPSFGNTAADAIQTAAAVADPPAYNGPANPLSSAALVEVAGSYDIDVPIAMYDNATVQVYIDAAAGDTYQIDLLARLDNQAAGDWQNINSVCTTAGTALGAAADPCALLTSFTTKKLYQELRIRRTKVGANGNAVARIWYKVGR
jgi:hypothetical protein